MKPLNDPEFHMNTPLNSLQGIFFSFLFTVVYADS